MFLAEKLNVKYRAETDIPLLQIISKLRQIKEYANKNTGVSSSNRAPNYRDISIYENIIKVNNLSTGWALKTMPIVDLVITLSDDNEITFIEAKLNYYPFQINGPLIGGSAGLVILFFIWKIFFTLDKFSILAIILYTFFLTFIIPLSIITYRRAVKDYLQNLFYDLSIKVDFALIK